MALPTLTKTWVISPNNRIVFVTLLDTMQKYLFQVKAFLKANGFTVKGSASAGVGAMDAVDRWTTSADVTPRATVAAASQAWVVLTSSGSGIDVLMTFQGSADHICRMSLSPSGNFVAAGTPQNQPTATDEIVEHNSTVSMVNSTASADRLWHGWVSSDAKSFRIALSRSGVWLPSLSVDGKTWGVENYVSTIANPIAVPTPVANPTFIWSMNNANMVPNGAQIGRTSITVASVPSVAPGHIVVHFGLESWPVVGVTSLYPLTFGNEKPELQGSLGYPILPLSLFAFTAPARGRMGQLIDWWMGRTAGDLAGDTYGTLEFIVSPGMVGTAGGGGVWPWDGVTVPVLT
jgi:hypothetical protein